RGKRSKLFTSAMRESALAFQAKAQSQGVIVEHLAEFGKISSVIDRLCHAKKRIEFVVIDKGIRLTAVSKDSPVPVFPVITTKSGQSSKTIFHNTQGKGVFAMSTISKAHHVKNCFIFGALTACLYAAVSTHTDFVMKYWAKGGIYALLPVATVFAVSYFHGNFTSSFWSMLGIEASKTTNKKPVETDRKVVAPRPDARPRAQVNA
ncbi:MAG: universal stress protein, partial [Desulfobulbus sp.]